MIAKMAARGLWAALALVAPVSAAAAPDDALVTPVRVGRPDAPLVLRVWAQQDYSHLAARPAIANVFRAIFAEWARAHDGAARAAAAVERFAVARVDSVRHTN